MTRAPFQIKKIFLSVVFILSINSVAVAEYPTDQRLQALIEQAGKFYKSKYIDLERRTGELFGIDFAEYGERFRSQIAQLNLKMSLIEKIQDPEEKNMRIRLLEEEYEDRGLIQYMQAYHYLHNEMERDHLFVGKYLSMLEEVLEIVIRKDPMFRYIFLSDEFRKEQGLALTRVVWRININSKVSASTEPLNLHSVFANKAVTPVLIKMTPVAFGSLAFLRSILIHELNHMYMFKDPAFSDVQRFGGQAIERPRGAFTHYFKSLNPFNPSYQYHLIHEYYSFKAQLMFDEIVEDSPFYKLDEYNKKNTEEIFAWVYSQLNEENKNFVDAHPAPPVFRTVRDFYSSR